MIAWHAPVMADPMARRCSADGCQLLEEEHASPDALEFAARIEEARTRWLGDADFIEASGTGSARARRVAAEALRGAAADLASILDAVRSGA